MTERTRPVLVIVGPPGAGKTTVAEELAARLGVTVRDTDADVEAIAGSTVQDVFIDHGEAHFRALEEKAVARALDEHDGVVALGGGAVLSDRTRERLRDHRVLFLDVGLTQAVRRVGLGTGRPLLLGNVRAQLKQLMDARHALYGEVADLTVLTDDLDPAQVTDQVLSTIGTDLPPTARHPRQETT
jgi:shikimate kinase